MRALFVLALLYLFLVAIQMLGGTFKDLGSDQAKLLIGQISNPFAALAVGVLATVLVQSSSVTTSTIVSAVSGLMATQTDPGTDPADLQAFISPFVPMIMGANIGTTITNTLVSMGHVTRSNEFQRAFAGATMHDFFNLLSVAVLLPIEILTGVLSKIAVFLVHSLHLGGGVEFKSPIKTAVKFGYQQIKTAVEGLTGLGKGDPVFVGLMVLLAVVVIFTCLVYITKNMKAVMAGRLERAINRVLERSGLLGIFIGILLTVSVQSSSITTSLLVPMFGAGLLTLENGFPICLGANIGTTVTALLAAVAGNHAGLAIAFVHLLFNIGGIVVFYPIPAVRRIPIRFGERLAAKASQSKWWILGYVGGVFVVTPLLGMLIFN
ncbi:MAG: sodium dependent phosphate transporter [Planctomycetes bacterium]|nr:sodium dependent phosphate transporter [Planctomycetota bacterium]